MTPTSPAWRKCTSAQAKATLAVVLIITIGTGLGTALFSDGAT